MALATRGTELVMKYAEQYLGDTEFGYQYSPEIFTGTEPEFAVEVCNAVMDVWQPDEGREIILNLPATVEMSTPNTYADLIEWFSRHVHNRQHIAIRTTIAAPRLRQRNWRSWPARDRVEAPSRHGERTGNADLVTQKEPLPGTIPRSTSPRSTRPSDGGVPHNLPVHPRHPYAGDLVYTAFSGSHQDAIKKGLEDLEARARERGIRVAEMEWEAPYLPIDPHDVGRTYEAVIRVNSQSGKGGVAYLMKSEHKLDLPRRLQIEFSKVVQAYTDADGGEVSSGTLWEIFQAEYLAQDQPLKLISVISASGTGQNDSVTARVIDEGRERNGEGRPGVGTRSRR
jgi:2-isopropylmalate synthase